MPLTVNWWLVKSGLKHGMGTERALGRGGAKAEAERARLAVAAPTEPVMPADRAQDASEPVHDVKAMLGMSGMGSADMPPQAHTADTHRATGDAPRPWECKHRADERGERHNSPETQARRLHRLHVARHQDNHHWNHARHHGVH